MSPDAITVMNLRFRSNRSSSSASKGPGHAEIDGLEQGRFVFTIREYRQRIARDRAIMAGALDRVGDRAMALDQPLGMSEISGGLIALFDDALPKAALLQGAAAVRQYDRQR